MVHSKLERWHVPVFETPCNTLVRCGGRRVLPGGCSTATHLGDYIPCCNERLFGKHWLPNEMLGNWQFTLHFHFHQTLSFLHRFGWLAESDSMIVIIAVWASEPKKRPWNYWDKCQSALCFESGLQWRLCIRNADW